VDKTETDSVVLIEDGKVYTHSTAALRIAGRFSGAWSYFKHLTIVPSIYPRRFLQTFRQISLQNVRQTGSVYAADAGSSRATN
jgi:predicted DCC family thiol-disulfide oxidoreductase YuxK